MSFTTYNAGDSVTNSEIVVTGLWTNNAYTLNTFATASGYTEYYLDVYNTGSGGVVQFDIQYGSPSGSGSAPINAAVPSNTPSRIVYGQYRTLVYGVESSNFIFDGGVTYPNNIYVINISRALYKESLLPGSLNLTLSGSGGKITLTDDSGTTNLTRFVGENVYYNLIAGSNGSGSLSTIYGMFLPNISTIILNGDLLASGNYITAASTGSTVVNNHLKLYNSIVLGNSFQLSSSETLSSTYFFTRITNSNYNYTSNPSITDTNGNIIYNTLINNPQTFVTTVGLYNNNNDLLAVAKLSKPLVKDFTKEALIRVKIDY